uniref:VQ domain-containing protein n=1 Tax=Oryza punctata TaxID=4537 RepID=A0A0E0M4W9_ORYPU
MEKQQAARPHWRRREPSDGEVYVVHPTHFRTVVQQLTGAPPPPPVAANANKNAIAANNFANANVAAQQNPPSHHQHSSSSNNNGSGGRGTTTLGQMHQECMAWAAQDDHDQHHTYM